MRRSWLVLAGLAALAVAAAVLVTGVEPIDGPSAAVAPPVSRPKEPSPRPRGAREASGVVAASRTEVVEAPVGLEDIKTEEEDDFIPLDEDQRPTGMRSAGPADLPQEMVRAVGGWDDLQWSPQRVAETEQRLGRSLTSTELDRLEQAFAAAQERAALAVGEYRLGRFDEARAMDEVDAAAAVYRADVEAVLGRSAAELFPPDGE